MSHWWTLPKQGQSEDENEDAVAASTGILVLADGATEAFFSRLWAHHLVEQLTGAATWWEHPEETWVTRVARAVEQWTEQLPPQESLPWHAQNKSLYGSAAAIAVLVFRSEQWRGIAVGDVTIFHLRGEELMQSWPLSAPEQYTTHPPLVQTRTVVAPLQVDGIWAEGDDLMVMTDALAAWSLRCVRDGRPLWAEVRALADETAWQDWVQRARADGMKNDDVTVALVPHPGGEEPRHELSQGK